MEKLGDIELTTAVCEALAHELAAFAHDERAAIEHVCNRFRVKKTEARRVVTAYRRGRLAASAGTRPAPAEGAYQGIHDAAFNIASGNPEHAPASLDIRQAKNDPPRERDPALRGIIINDTHVYMWAITITASIAMLVGWQTDMTGWRAVVVALFSSLPWFFIVTAGLNRIESLTICVVFSIIALAASFNIGNGMPWTALAVGFLAANYAPTLRARYAAQSQLESLGVRKFRDQYGSAYDAELAKLD